MELEIVQHELQCTICMEVVIQAINLNCGHTFCNYCIQKWEKKKKLCPICRVEITTHSKVLLLDNYIAKLFELVPENLRGHRDKVIRKRTEELRCGSNSSFRTTIASIDDSHISWITDEEIYDSENEEMSNISSSIDETIGAGNEEVGSSSADNEENVISYSEELNSSLSFNEESFNSENEELCSSSPANEESAALDSISSSSNGSLILENEELSIDLINDELNDNSGPNAKYVDSDVLIISPSFNQVVLVSDSEEFSSCSSPNNTDIDVYPISSSIASENLDNSSSSNDRSIDPDDD